MPVLQGEDSVEFPASGVEVAGAGVEPRGDGVCVCWGAYPPAHRLRRHVTQFCWLVAGADDFESLGHAHVAGVTLANLLPQNGSLSREPFAGIDIAVEQRECGLPGAQQVVVAGLAQPLGEVGVLGECGAEGGRALLQLRGGQQQQGLGESFPVVGLFG